MLDTIGWFGAILFAVCGIPQAWQCWKQGNANGMAWVFLLCWFFGELLTIVYVIPKRDLPLLFNYTINLVCLLIILYYKIRPRSK
jgi:uncharacterized protein with PQ loop repeat